MDSYSKVLYQIQQLQEIQMTHSSKSVEWLDASAKLQPLFARMVEITSSLNTKGEVTR